MPRETYPTSAARAGHPARRAVLTGIGASLACPGWAAAQSPDHAVRLALDEAAKLPPAEGLARLAGFTPAAPTLTPAQRLDLITARAGLAIDAQLERMPGTRGRKGGYRPLPGAGKIAPDHYALLLRRPLGTVGPHVARTRLTQALARLHARAEPLFAQIGLDKGSVDGSVGGSVGERFRMLWRDERYLYPDSDAGRTAAVADMARQLAGARARVPALIGAVPAWCLDVGVRGLSAEELAAGKGGYRTVPAPDRPGGYVADLTRIRDRPSWTLPSVVAHELIPGHMIQLGLEGVVAPHPLRIDYAAAFVEGWGIHAETLAAADGAFADPRSMLGHLHWLIFRVARALADIGIHLDGWSADRARAALVAWQGEPAYFAPFDTELTRIVQEPASRVAEAMAWLAIADAGQHLQGGARRALHQTLLTHGRRRTDAIGGG